MTCLVGGCSREIVYKKKGMCASHYVIDWQRNNRDKVHEKRRRYFATEKGKRVKKESVERRRMFEKTRQRHRGYQEKMYVRFNRLKWRCKKTQRECDFTRAAYEEIVGLGCYYCGAEIRTGVGLDRIDNHKGYLIENCLPCCGFCNSVRGAHLSVEETKRVVILLKEMRKKENVWDGYKYHFGVVSEV